MSALQGHDPFTRALGAGADWGDNAAAAAAARSPATSPLAEATRKRRLSRWVWTFDRIKRSCDNTGHLRTSVVLLSMT